MADQSMIEEQNVTAVALSEVFRAAYMDVHAVNEHSFTVKGLQFPFHLGISVEPGHKLVSFLDQNRLYRIDKADALALCNEANANLGPARFFVFQHQTGLVVVTHYQLTFERGIFPFHLITTFRTFEQCVGSALSGLFKDYIRP